METAITFLSDNWESISAVLLWVAVRLIPTKKNYDVVEGIIKVIGQIIPNNKVDSLGNKQK